MNAKIREAGKVVLLFTIFFSPFIAWECFWRARGFRPMPLDNVALWNSTLSGANRTSSSLVLAGSSRFALGIDTYTLQRSIPDLRVVQLSIDGGSPLSILRHLANNDEFRGHVLCEVLPQYYFTDLPSGKCWPRHAGDPDYIDLYLMTTLSKHMVWFRPELATWDAISYVRIHKALPIPGPITFSVTRDKSLDYSRVDARQALERNGFSYNTAGTTLGPGPLIGKLKDVNDDVRRIHQRGGRVLFVQMPASGVVRDVEHARYPEATWNAFMKNVSAPLIRYERFTELARFDCPDGAHLDVRDRTAFTESFARVLAGRSDW